MKKKSRLDLINEFELIHGERYDYSDLVYVNAKTKVNIRCKNHGSFLQLPSNHLKGNGCPKCASNKFDIKHVVNQFKKTHGNKYDYSLVDYKGDGEKIKIICSIHGEFTQTPSNHKRGNECPECRKNKKLNKSSFIKKAVSIHGNKYDYSPVKYKNTLEKVEIRCKEHGSFMQTPGNHLSGNGCSKCNGNNKKTTKEFINLSKSVHGDNYDYSLTKYINAKSEVKIICKKHGVFLQKSHNHLQGNGCPLCNESKGEAKIRSFLEKNEIKFTPQKKFDSCKNKKRLPFDFYLDDLNVCIEFNGIQHYKSVKHFGGDRGLRERKKNDKIKVEYCKKNNIPLIIIKYNQDVNSTIKKWLCAHSYLKHLL